MFIVTDKNGKDYKEGQVENGKILTWDGIPRDIKIVQLQLTYPFKVQFRETRASRPKTFAPLLAFGKFDQYYFTNEATVTLLVHGDQPAQEKRTTLEAKIIGGIDKKRDLVIEIRLDKTGNCLINRFSLKDLKVRIKNGTFKDDILRDGAL